jgi:serine/threonine protein phosphatase PrpC
MIDINDEALVIASDGVWEFLSNEQVAQIVHQYYKSQEAEVAANTVLHAAYAQWTQNQPIVDDMTIIIVFLDKRLIQKSTDAQ